MVIFHSYVSLPEGIRLAVVTQLQKKTWKIDRIGVPLQPPFFSNIWFLIPMEAVGCSLG
jgi:hypothetical protein